MKKSILKLHFMSFASRATLIALMLAPSIYGAADDDLKKKNLSLQAALGNTKLVKDLIKDGADVNYKNKEDLTTPLMWAALAGHLPVVKILIEAGAEINHQNKYQANANESEQDAWNRAIKQSGQTALTLAIAYGRTSVAKELIKNGANLNTKTTGGGYTPLMLAVQYALRTKEGTKPEGNTGDIIKDLIKAGADSSIKDRTGHTAYTQSSDPTVQKIYRRAIRARRKELNSPTAGG